MTLRTRTAVLFFIFIGLLVYFNSLTNRFMGDDIDQILRNRMVHSLWNIPLFFGSGTYENAGAQLPNALYYRPLMMIGYTGIYSAAGSDVFYFHLVQVLLHIINTILVFFLFKRFFPQILSFFLSLVFLVHPINAEPVVQIANLQDVMFETLGLGGMLLITRKDFPNRKIYLFLAAVCFFVSLFAKETGVLFMLVALGYLVLSRRFTWLTPLLFGAAVGSYLFIRFFLAKIFFAKGLIGPIAHQSLPERLLNIPAIIAFYIKTFLLPKDLIIVQYWTVDAITSVSFFLPLVFVISLVIAWLLFVAKLRKEKNTQLLIFLFFSVWLMVGLMMHVQITPLDSTVADRWFYFPIIGALGMIGVITQTIKLRSVFAKRVAVTGFIIVLTLLAVRTVIRNANWHTPKQLYLHDLAKTPDNFYLANLLGIEYLLDKDYKTAKKYFEHSVTIYPYAGNLNNLASVYLQEGDIQRAKKTLEKALLLGENYLLSKNYAAFLLVHESPQAAKLYAEKALKVFPKQLQLWMILADAEFALGNKEAGRKAQKNGLALFRK